VPTILVAAWASQCQACPTALVDGGGRPLASARDSPDLCFLFPARKRRPTALPFACVTAAGVATAVSFLFDFSSGCSCPDNVSDPAFAATPAEAEAEPSAMSSLVDGGTSRVSNDCAGVGTRSERHCCNSTPRSEGPGPTISPALEWASNTKPRPKKTATVAVATALREMRWSRVSTMGRVISGRSSGAAPVSPDILTDPP
jgi:hypothetical protein